MQIKWSFRLLCVQPHNIGATPPLLPSVIMSAVSAYAAENGGQDPTTTPPTNYNSMNNSKYTLD